MSEFEDPDMVAVDKKVAISRLSKIAQHLGCLAGTAMAGLSGYAFTDRPLIGLAGMGASALVNGSVSRLSFESGAARRRVRDRELVGVTAGTFGYERENNANLQATIVGALGFTTSAFLTGMGIFANQHQVDLVNLHPDILGVLSATGALVQPVIGRTAGESMDNLPKLHQALHIATPDIQ